jgi:hypothetical protein
VRASEYTEPRITYRHTVSPSTDGSVFAADRVVELVTKEDSSIGDCDVLLVADFDLLLAVVVVHFESEVVHCIHAL